MFDELLTIEELEAGTRRLATDPRARITLLGQSRLGRPIEMISIGEGDRDALIVGVPHPNEPAGAVTVERMIFTMLENEEERRGYRWHFIKAIDPEGLRLNAGWLKTPRTPQRYLENFFRPALSRQPETTFPLNIPEARFSGSMPENEAWQRAFALTRPVLHASLHHCDFGGVFYSLSRALPGALSGLEAAVRAAGLSVHRLKDDVMTVDRWTPAVARYPTVVETMANAKAMHAAWAYPWTVGDMSPGFGESRYGTFTVVAEVPLWHSKALEDPTPSDVESGAQMHELAAISHRACTFALHHLTQYREAELGADARECLWALQTGLKMMPSSDAACGANAPRILTRHEFELHHTHDALLVLRTYGLLISLANQALNDAPGSRVALRTREEATAALHAELDALEARSILEPVPIRVMTGLQMAAIFVCADALNATAHA